MILNTKYIYTSNDDWGCTMTDSILDTIKNMLGLDSEYDAFDVELINYINSAFFVLSQLGIGSSEGFFISGQSEIWSDYVDSKSNLKAIQTFIKLKVQLLFDPPSNSFVVDAINKQMDELIWRLCLEAEEV